MSSLLSTLGSYCTTRAMHLRALLLTLDTSSFPSKESSNSAAGHSGVLTVVSLVTTLSLKAAEMS